MRKIYLFLLALMTCVVGAWADGYRVGFDTNLNVGNTARRVNSIKIGDDVKTLEADNKMYRDLHETVVFEVAPGATVTPGFVLNGGGWMHGLVYVDLNQNGDFATYDGDSFTLDAGENVANSASSGNLGSTFSCGSFTAPSKAGDYRMRFKVDWNGGDPRALNPAGRIGNNGTYGSGDGNSIVANSGSIVDVTLRVESDFSKITFNFEGAANKSYTVDVINGKTPTLPVSIPSYVDYTVSPALAAASGNATYTVTTSYNESMPFQVAADKYYNLNMNRTPNLKIYTEGEAIKTVSGTEVTSKNQDNFKWQFGGDWLNGFTLKNKTANKYVTYNSANPADKFTAVLTDTPAEGAYYDLIVNGGKNYFKIHGTTNNAYISNNGGVGTTFLTNWNSANNIGDAGAQIIISEAQEIATITYNYYFENVDRSTETIEAVKGEAYPAAHVPYGVVAPVPEGTVTGDEEIRIDCTLADDYPFQYSYTNPTKWYTLTIRGNKYPTYNAITNHFDNKTTKPTELTKNDLFAFHGTPWSFVIANGAKYNDMLGCSYGDGNKLEIVDITDENLMYFQLENNDGHLVFVCMADDDQKRSGHLNDVKGELGIWTADASATDGGSTLTFEPVDDEVAKNLLVKYDWVTFENYINQLQAVSFGDGLGEYSFGDPMMDAYAPNIIDELAAYLDDKDNVAPFDYEYAMGAMQEMLESMQLNLPKPGSFLRIKGAATNKYISGNGVANAQAPLTSNENEAVLYYTEDSKLVSPTCGMGFSGTHSYTAGVAIEAQTFSEAPYKTGAYLIKSNYSGSKVFVDWTDGKLNRWGTENDQRSTWYVEEVDFIPVTLSTIGGHNYGTFYTPVGISDLDGVKAYIATEENGKAVMTAIETIPANTAVVLYAKDADKTSATFTIGEADADTDDNILAGQAATIAKVEGACTLQNGSNGLGFYSYTGAALKGFKAYLNASEHSVKSFTLDFDMETAIRGIQEAEEKGAAMYDMSGRRILKAQKGVYIQNGKKYVK